MKHDFTPSSAPVCIPAQCANDDEPAILSDAGLLKAARAYVLDPSVINGMELEMCAFAEDYTLEDITLLVEHTRAQIEALKRSAAAMGENDASPYL
jgi:hypothetical protein